MFWLTQWDKYWFWKPIISEKPYFSNIQTFLDLNWKLNQPGALSLVIQTFPFSKGRRRYNCSNTLSYGNSDFRVSGSWYHISTYHCSTTKYEVGIIIPFLEEEKWGAESLVDDLLKIVLWSKTRTQILTAFLLHCICHSRVQFMGLALQAQKLDF